jgi:hypothetical protein
MGSFIGRRDGKFKLPSWWRPVVRSRRVLGVSEDSDV